MKLKFPFYKTIGLQTYLLSKRCVHKNNCSLLYFHKNVTFLHVGLLRVFSLSPLQCKVVNWWVTTNCCIRSNGVFLQKLVTLRRKSLAPSLWQKKQDLMAEADSHMKWHLLKIEKQKLVGGGEIPLRAVAWTWLHHSVLKFFKP